MTDTAGVPRKRDGGEPGRRPLIDDELADRLLDRAQAEGAELLGPDGLLSQVTRAVLERALAEEMTGHLGMKSTTRPAAGRATAATAPPQRPCSPTWARWT
jgi:putative transposase